jgi:dienelactone hydrolase
MTKTKISLILSIILAFSFLLETREAPARQNGLPVQWPKSLFSTPKTYPAPKKYDSAGVKSAFIEGLPYKGKTTRIYVYYGIPVLKNGEKCPGMVLVHGGGGTAFPEWVKLWNSRGYAAIAMDTCGSLPGGEHGKRPRHEFGGPPGWGNFGASLEPVNEQWPYHAVSSVIAAHSFLRSLPGVDPDRIGITGISWGGYLTCLTAAADNRFKFAVPVYGCGFLGENSVWKPELEKLSETGKLWLDLWDPKHYLPMVTIPTLWVDGTNDFAYPMDSLQKSYRLTKASRTLCIRVRMPHAHGGPGENPAEILAFADNIFKSGPALSVITGQGRDNDRAWITYESEAPSLTAELLFTKDTGIWQDRKWEKLKAFVNKKTNTVTAILPEGVKVYYINLIDKNGLVVSSEHVEL